VVDERLLQRMQRAIDSEPFDRGDLGAVPLAELPREFITLGGAALGWPLGAFQWHDWDLRSVVTAFEPVTTEAPHWRQSGDTGPLCPVPPQIARLHRSPAAIGSPVVPARTLISNPRDANDRSFPRTSLLR
jgi:hypothetical protein